MHFGSLKYCRKSGACSRRVVTGVPWMIRNGTREPTTRGAQQASRRRLHVDQRSGNSDNDPSRRWRGRSTVEQRLFEVVIRPAQIGEIGRGGEGYGDWLRREEVLQFEAPAWSGVGRIFLISFFGLANGEAKRARMISIEGFQRALYYSLFGRVFDDHLTPCDHLKHAIMPTTEMEAASKDNKET